jgi:hypothetical protein
LCFRLPVKRGPVLKLAEPGGQQTGLLSLPTLYLKAEAESSFRNVLIFYCYNLIIIVIIVVVVVVIIIIIIIIICESAAPVGPSFR